MTDGTPFGADPLVVRKLVARLLRVLFGIVMDVITPSVMNRTSSDFALSPLGRLLRGLVVAVSLLGSHVAVAADAPAPVDDDLNKEAEASEAQAAVDGSTGKTLQERIRAVSRRTFLKADRFELTPGFGFSTNDPFFRAWAVGARGAYHFSEEFALDFGGAGSVFQEQQDIFRVLNVDPDDLAADVKDKLAATSLLAYVDAGVTFSPFYGKVALASELVGHFDVFVSGGLAAIFDTAPELVHPGLELGIGGRLYLNRFLALRADVRNYLYPANSAGNLVLGNLLLLNFGVAIYFPLEFDYQAETLGAKD
jgi:outer membrane beta-barrel protein